MPTVYALFPDTQQQWLASDGTLASGYRIFIYAAGTSTKSTTYQESDGISTNTNPIELDSLGRTPYGVYVEDGSYKIVFADDGVDDPPGTPIDTRDNVSPAGLPTVTVAEWLTTTWTPAQITSTTFSLATADGDQTGELHVGRRIRTADTAGTDYATITDSNYDSTVANSTWVEVTVDGAGSLDSGLSAVAYSILSADSSSTPHLLSDSAGLTLSAESDLTLSSDPETALDALPLRMLGPDWISGLTLSPNSTDPDSVDIAVGATVDSGGTHGLALTTALGKQLDVAHAHGGTPGTPSGGLGSGLTYTASTWYHAFLIQRDTDNAIDAYFDTSIAAANIPAGYTRYQRIGSVVTDATPDVVHFKQIGSMFYWGTPTTDLSSSITASSASYALTNASAGVPPGVESEIWANIDLSASVVYITSTDTDFGDPSVATPNVTVDSASNTVGLVGPILVDTSQQIDAKANTGTPTLIVSVVCYRDKRTL